MIRILLIALLLLAAAWAFWRLIDGVIEAFGGTTAKRARKRGNAAVKLVRDPVCGTWVSPASSRNLQSGSGTYYFCSDECRAKFQKR